jgi:hypothetical protein
LSVLISAHDPSRTLESVTGTPEPDFVIALEAVDEGTAVVFVVIGVVVVTGNVFVEVVACEPAVLLQPIEMKKVGTSNIATAMTNGENVRFFLVLREACFMVIFS